MDWEKMPWERGNSGGGLEVGGLMQNTRPGLCSGARDELGSRVPSSSFHLEAPWVHIPASPGCLPCLGVGLCPQCPSAGAPGAGTGLTAPLVPPFPCLDHSTSLEMWVPAQGTPPCPHRPGAAGRVLLDQG